MMETTNATNSTYQPLQTGKKVLSYVKNERTAGYIPKWSEPETAKEQIQQNLELAPLDPQSSDFQTALAAQNSTYNSANQDEFGFGDLVDMVNPLQHIPVVNHLYREVTGDDIKSIGSIIGGALYGGAMGAASGLVNAVVKEETGTDITGNLTAMVLPDHKPETPTYSSAAPEQRLEQAQDIADQDEELTTMLLGFTDNGNSAIRSARFEHFKELHNESLNKLEEMPELGEREEITKLAAFTMPDA